jgi:four helix bundle protein
MNPEEPKRYNLDERTARFGEAIIAYAKKVPVAPVTRPLIDQLVRAGTSVGANYCEADDAESKKAFRNNICRCRKEARETKHWLRMIGAAIESEELKAEGRVLWLEAKELNLIFSAIVRKCDE